MAQGRLYKAVIAFSLSLFAIPATLIYWGTRPPLEVKRLPVQLVVQKHDTSVAVALDTRGYAGLDDVYFYTTVVDMSGSEIVRTQPLFVDPDANYKLITYRNLPLGVFNVNLHVNYKLNPMAHRYDCKTQAVLNVIPKTEN